MADVREFSSLGMHAFVQTICGCGWMSTEAANGVYYCENPFCPQRLRMFTVNVVAKEIAEGTAQ